MKMLIIFATICGAILSAAAQDPYKIGVKLQITGKSGLEDEVRSYFTREFRAIGDVEVTDEQPLVVVSIVILESRNKAGQSIGYAISLAIADKMPVIILAVAGKFSTADPVRHQRIDQVTPERGILVDHILEVLDTESLAKSCKQLAAQIDGSHLEGVRKMRRALQKMVPNQVK